MRIVMQNVLSASVAVNNSIVASIDRGLLLLVGFTHGDNAAVIKKMVAKVVNARVFQDENGLTNLSLANVNGNILSVSQFTLYGDLLKGNRPSFVSALVPSEAKKLYEIFNRQLEEITEKEIKCGMFGEDMKVSLINDGPFTMILDSKELVK